MMGYEIGWCDCSSVVCFFFFKQKTAYEIGWCDWSSDVCSNSLPGSRVATETVRCCEWSTLEIARGRASLFLIVSDRSAGSSENALMKIAGTGSIAMGGVT